MPFNVGPIELIIILVIVIALFGAGRIAGVGRALGTSVREFRQEARPEDEEEAETTASDGEAEASTTEASAAKDADDMRGSGDRGRTA